MHSLSKYQDCWDILKQDLLDIFKDFYNFSFVNAIANSPFICLIPKKNEFLRLSEFRPISSVTNLYKIVAKVLSLRLMDVLREIASTAQGAFARDR